jgi:hypothetical protein
MSSQSVCQVTHSWVEVGSFHMHLVARFMIVTVSVRNILDTPSFTRGKIKQFSTGNFSDSPMLLLNVVF